MNFIFRKVDIEVHKAVVDLAPMGDCFQDSTEMRDRVGDFDINFFTLRWLINIDDSSQTGSYFVKSVD